MDSNTLPPTLHTIGMRAGVTVLWTVIDIINTLLSTSSYNHITNTLTTIYISVPGLNPENAAGGQIETFQNVGGLIL